MAVSKQDPGKRAFMIKLLRQRDVAEVQAKERAVYQIRLGERARQGTENGSRRDGKNAKRNVNVKGHKGHGFNPRSPRDSNAQGQNKDAETRYTVGEQELLAVYHALQIWRCYLEGNCPVIVVTDHAPNTWLETQPTLCRRQARWSEFLQRFKLHPPFRPIYRLSPVEKEEVT